MKATTFWLSDGSRDMEKEGTGEGIYEEMDAPFSMRQNISYSSVAHSRL